MRRLVLALILILTPAAAHAHPHEWIDVRSGLVFSGGNIVAIEQHWLFDTFYTALSLPDFDANGNKKLDPAELMELAQENLHNLRDFQYFTSVDVGGKPAVFSGVSGISSRLEGGRVALSFTLTLDKPVNPVKTSVSYRIYDPSYYVSMRHEKAEGAITLKQAPLGCKYTLDIPSPDAVWVTLASSLDKNATAPDDLGKNFAEKVSITCP